ncbi:DUF433 domain-containing protein [Leptolyngbya sp. FACHB-261]|uniref:DUF433 domain-containing protein n=1 Tax=Leptolyngbya sp. FACHB-261 TaxID=2692806 RepID=UPI001687CF8E|nr:DUF433 domain-containing protein [Leptolyngbya sp. FACHB-261]MBD2104746.1 DUF433 domain-containing protein [Leptolyngbya sp. FACHB-261]
MNLPPQLQQEAEKWAAQQGISLEQFILRAITEKIGNLSQQLDDPAFPEITQRQGASGLLTPDLRGTRVRVQTLVVAAQQWGLPANQIAAEYSLTEAQVNAALAFYEAHRAQIDTAITVEQNLEAANV